MSLWLERVRAALAPKGYDVEREVASGGMGSVCLARHRVLGHQVAIKIIRPELHTAQAAERFRREAAILARIRHPNVVPVHDADEADGLPYYVMDFLEGQTLATRLRDGPLSPTEALKLGRDLLDALAAAHRHGVVHRDVKPANVFVVDGRAVLVDFGVAKPLGAASGADATAPGAVVGTFRYMAPEQLCGGDITPRTDVYAAALVIYEAYTGRLWDLAAVPRRADWRGVPRRVARVLACALALAPEERWSDATTFRRALWHTRVAPYRWRTGWLTAGGLVAGALASAWLAGRWAAGRPPFGPAGFELHVVPFEPLGAADRTLAGAVADGVARGLAGHVDFSVAGPAPLPWFVRRSTAVLGGSVVRSGDSLRVALELRAPGWGRTGRVLEARGTVERLDRVVDTLVYGVVREVWNRENPLDPSLPLAALPRSSDALVAWLGAERLLAAGRWRDADSAYGAVEALDSACWLCAWRHAQVGQWLGLTADAGEAGRYLRHAEAFPPKYQALMRAQALGLAARLEALAAAARTWRDFFLGWFMLGDETFHRGPLVGRPRGGAVEWFRRGGRSRRKATRAERRQRCSACARRPRSRTRSAAGCGRCSRWVSRGDFFPSPKRGRRPGRRSPTPASQASPMSPPVLATCSPSTRRAARSRWGGSSGRAATVPSWCGRVWSRRRSATWRWAGPIRRLPRRRRWRIASATPTPRCLRPSSLRCCGLRIGTPPGRPAIPQCAPGWPWRRVRASPRRRRAAARRGCCSCSGPGPARGMTPRARCWPPSRRRAP